VDPPRHPILHKIGRALRFLGFALLALVGFIVAVVAVVLSILDTPPVRKLAAREVNQILAGQFQGHVVITRLGHLSIFGVGGVDAAISSADRRPLLAAQGVSAALSPFPILKSALLGKGDIVITVNRIEVDQVDVDVDSGPDGSLELVHAFDSKTPPTPPKPGERGIAISMPDIGLAHAWAHGIAPGTLLVDAEVSKAKVAFGTDSNATTLDVSQLSLLARGLPKGITLSTGVEAHLVLPAAEGASMVLHGALDGRVGRIPFTADVKMNGDALDGVLDVPEVTAQDVQASVEDAPVFATVGAHAEAHGALSKLDVKLHARLGDGSLDSAGELHLKDGVSGEVSLAAKHIDARTFAATAPATDVGANVHAVADAGTGSSLAVRVNVDIPVGSAAGQVVPHTSLHAVAIRRISKEGAAPSLTGHLEGVIDEAGAPIALSADARSRGEVTDVTFGVSADAPRIGQVRRLGNIGKGSLDVTVSGHARVAKEVTFEAEAEARGSAIDAKGVQVDALGITASATGALSSPSLRVRALARGLAAGGYRFSRAEIVAAGTPSRTAIAASLDGVNAPNATLTTNLSVLPILGATDVDLTLKRDKESLGLTVDSVRAGGGSLAVSGLLVRGAGEPLEATVRLAPGSVNLQAKTVGIDLGKVAYLAGQDKAMSGTLALDVDLEANRSHAKGKVSLDLRDAAFSKIKDAGAHVALVLDGRHLTGELRGGVGDAGSLSVRDIDVHMGGQGPVSVSGWRNAWGKVHLVSDVDLAKVAELVPVESLHVSDVAGHVTVDGELARDSLEDTTPEIRLEVATTGLAALGEAGAPIRKPGGPLMVGPATWTLSGVDARMSLIVDGESSDGELSFRMIDKVGPLLALDVKTAALPFADVLSNSGQVVARLEELPVGVRVEMPTRDIGWLPLLIRPDGVRGKGAGILTMSGTARDPQIDLAVHGKELIATASPGTKMDVEANVTYDGAHARVGADVTSKGAKLLRADATMEVSAADLLRGAVDTLAWKAGASAVLSRFPLSAVSMLKAQQVKGFLSGKIEVTGLHQDGKADVDLAFDDLSLGKAKFTKATAVATVDDRGLLAKARFEAPEGFLEANAKMGMKWGQSAVPVSDGTGLEASLDAKHFPASAAAPFAGVVVSDLSGWLDANAKVVLAPQRKPVMSGAVAFSDGVIDAPSIGEEFHAVTAKVTLAEDGVIKLENVGASGVSGRLTASGSAHLDGTNLTAADLTLNINKKEAIPLDVQGTNLGTVYGKIDTKVTGAPDGSRLDVAINVPTFHVDMPAAGFPRTPEALGNTPGIHVGVYRDPDRFVLLSQDATPVVEILRRNRVEAALPTASTPKEAAVTHPMDGASTTPPAKPEPTMKLAVSVNLGDVSVTRGQQVALDLGGAMKADIASVVLVRGEVRIKNGKLNVQGKEFEIQKGTVSFVGDDPSNPEVNVTAEWTAPDATHVFADYVGPVKTGKVNLRSEPPRPKNEIVSLILFGTADGSSATPYASKSPSTGTQAGTTVGGLATDGLSKGLDQLTGMNVTTKIDTSDSANPRPEVEVQIAKDISLELAFVIGTPPPGQNPDTTYATIDWRFVRNWSLATTFGDEGSTFADLVWAHRY
jgi:translocation and assembly module TamB